MNREAYERMIDGDLEVLKGLDQSLEREHITQVLKWSIKLNYETIPGLRDEVHNLLVQNSDLKNMILSKLDSVEKNMEKVTRLFSERKAG